MNSNDSLMSSWNSYRGAPSLPYANLTTQARGVLRAWAKATAKKCCDWGLTHLMNMSEHVHRFSLVHSILCSINLPFWESNYHHSSTQLWRKIKSGKLKCLNEEQSITLCMIYASCITSETDVVRNLAIWFAVLILCWTLLMFWIETLVYRVCHSIIFRLTFILLAPGVIRKTIAACCFVLGGLRQQPQVKSGSRERGGTVWHNGCPLVLACALAWRATYMT
jgi:hypothetical protein